MAPDWTKFYPIAALLLIPAIAIGLIVGLVTGNQRIGVLMAAGAFTVGLGSFQQLGASRTLPMLLSAGGMCIASWIGTLAGVSPLTAVLVITLAAYVYARISHLGQSETWVGLQCVVWLAISTAYPAHGLQVLNRGALILAGGLLQTAIFALWWHVGCSRQSEDSLSECFPNPNNAGQSQGISLGRATVTVAIAAILYEWLSAQNGYWIPMTTLIVLRPVLNQTVQRGIARIVGTMAGATLASAIVSGLHADPWILAAGVVLFAWASYALLNVNYVYFAVFLTAYVVFLLSLAGLNERSVVVHRVIFTAIGGGLALATHVVWSHKAWFAARFGNSAT